jgi:hypothetical protein
MMITYFRENVLAILGVMMLALLLVGYLLFVGIVLWPQWQVRADLQSRVQAARLAVSQQDDGTSPTVALEDEYAPSQSEIAEAEQLFLTEQQAADVLNAVSDNAAASGVTIIDLQAQPSSDGVQKSLYDVRSFSFAAAGGVDALLDFMVLSQETAVSPIQLSNVQLTSEGDGSTLTFVLQLYTSPYASGFALADMPAGPTPLPQPIPVPIQPSTTELLTQQLHEAWSAEDWPTAILTIDEILKLDPDYPEMADKLYAAHVNYGYQLLDEDDEAAAKVQFEQALSIFPNGIEATTALQSLAGENSASLTNHIVRHGETLFSIARQYGVTVDALRSANNLSGNGIVTGQELIIP